MHEALTKLYHVLFPARPAQLAFLTGLAAPPGRALDVACGTAEYAAALADRGYDSWAVELDPLMLDQARLRHPALASAGRLVLGDMRELTRLVQGPFDLVFCIGNSLPQLAQVDEVGPVLEQMIKLTADSGAIAIQVVNYDRVLADLATTDRLEMPPLTGAGADGTPVELLRWNEPRRETDPPDILRFCTRISLGKEHYESTAHLLALTRARIEECLPAGANAEWFGGFDRSPWTSQSPATILVLHRSPTGV